MNKNLAILGAGVAGLLVGGGVGYFVADKLLNQKYEQILQTEIASVKEQYQRVYKAGDFETIEGAAEAFGVTPDAEEDGPIVDEGADIRDTAVDALNKYRRSSDDTPEDLTPRRDNVDNPTTISRVDDNDEYDYSYMEKDSPIFVVSKISYMENDEDFSQDTLTYYSDGVLADPFDNEVSTDLVGSEFHRFFGNQSGDPNTVYIRNQERSVDYEIIRVTASYGESVAGFMQHTDDPRMRRQSPRRSELE